MAFHMSTKAEQCPVCGTGLTWYWGEIDGYLFKRCNSCGHLYVSSPVTAEMLEKAYGASYYGASGGSETARNGYDNYLRNLEKRLSGFRRTVDFLERYASPRGRVLDYGCAIGLFVKAAKERGWQAVGYDKSDWAVAYGREHFDLDLRSGSMPEFEADSFDLITLWDCIEHLPDPHGTLEQLCSWLRPGGVIAIQTVNSSSLGARLAGQNWRHLAPPLHLHMFSVGSLRTLLSRFGLKVEHTEGGGVIFGARSRSRSAETVVSTIDRFLGHWHLRFITNLLNFKDEILVIARKPVQIGRN